MKDWMWTVRTLDHAGVWFWYLHRYETPGKGVTYPTDGKMYADQGTATLVCDMLNIRDFGEIDPAPYKGYWKERP